MTDARHEFRGTTEIGALDIEYWSSELWLSVAMTRKSGGGPMEPIAGTAESVTQRLEYAIATPAVWGSGVTTTTATASVSTRSPRRGTSTVVDRDNAIYEIELRDWPEMIRMVSCLVSLSVMPRYASGGIVAPSSTWVTSSWSRGVRMSSDGRH